jgi:hypothetical protein
VYFQPNSCNTHADREWARGTFLRQRRKIPPAHAQWVWVNVCWRILILRCASKRPAPAKFCLYTPENTYKFTWSFEPYVEFVPYSTRVLGLKGRAVGWGIGPLPYPSLVCLLPIIGRPCPGTSTLNTLSACGVCRDLVRLALCGKHWTHF